MKIAYTLMLAIMVAVTMAVSACFYPYDNGGYWGYWHHEEPNWGGGWHGDDHGGDHHDHR